MPNFPRASSSFLLGLFFLSAPSLALADDDAGWGLPAKAPLPTHPPIVRTAAKEAPVPPAPSPAPTAEEPSCAVNKREGFTDADVAAVEEVICSEIREKGHPGRYRIHLGKLGAKIIVTLVECIEASTVERQVVLSDLGELTVAAPRLIEANQERKPVADTLDVSNVVGDEARTPKKRPSAVHAWLGLLGAGGAGGTGAGVNLAISAGSERWSFVGDFRLAGEAFNKPAIIAGEIFTLGGIDADGDSDFSYVSLTGGARYHVLKTDFSPFIGAGLGVDYIGRDGATRNATPYYGGSEPSTGKTGLAGYSEVGLDLLRTHLVGGAITFRVDLPTFAVTETKPDPTNERRYLKRSTYAPILTAGFAFRF